MWGEDGRNQKQKACQKLPRERRWWSPWSLPQAPLKAGRAAQHWHDRPLCSNLALVGAPGWRAGSAGKPQPMATPAHQLEHPLLLHSTALACSCILPAAPQEHLHVLGNKKVHADGLAFSAPGAHCLWSMRGCCQTPSHTLEPLRAATALPPAAAKALLLNLYLGQNPGSPQNLIYFLLPLSHQVHLGKMPAPKASSTTFPFSSGLVWWLFSPGRAVFFHCQFPSPPLV